MFYDRFKLLCGNKGVSCNKAALDMGLSNATPTKWKKSGATPSGDTLNKIAGYFGVTVDYLLGKETIATKDMLATADVQNPENQLQSIFSKHGIINISKLTGISEDTLRKYMNGENVPEMDMQRILIAAAGLESDDAPQGANQNMSVLAFGGGGENLTALGYESERLRILADEAETEKKLEIIDFIKKNSFSIEKLNTIYTIIRALCFDKK